MAHWICEVDGGSFQARSALANVSYGAFSLTQVKQNTFAIISINADTSTETSTQCFLLYIFGEITI